MESPETLVLQQKIIFTSVPLRTYTHVCVNVHAHTHTYSQTIYIVYGEWQDYYYRHKNITIGIK